MEFDYEYLVDYEVTGEGVCASCITCIPGDTLRIARLFKHFDSLKWDDQDLIRTFFNRSAILDDPNKDLYIESADSEGYCYACDMPLSEEKHVIRRIGLPAATVHFSCYVHEFFPTNMSTLGGFNQFPRNVRDKLVLELARYTQTSLKLAMRNRRPYPISRNMDPRDSRKSYYGETFELVEERKLILQSRLLWNVKNQLSILDDDAIGLLEYNWQHVPGGGGRRLSEALADALFFGALGLCPNCANGPLMYHDGYYKCSARSNDWTICPYKTREPIRHEFCVPSEYRIEKYLISYTYIARTRQFQPDCAPIVVGPLTGYTVFLVDRHFIGGKKRRQLMDEFRDMGANIAVKSIRGVLISCCPRVFDLLGKVTVKKFKYLELLVVNTTLLEDLSVKTKVTDSELDCLLTKHTLSKWPAKVHRSKATVRHLTRLDNDYIDPRDGHVNYDDIVLGPQGHRSRSCLFSTPLRDSKGAPMQTVLVSSDPSRRWRKVQKLRVFIPTISCPERGIQWDFNQLYSLTTSTATNMFKNIYYNQTGNTWKNRGKFCGKRHKYEELSLDSSKNKRMRKNLHRAEDSPSTLHPEIQSLIRFICDMQFMKDTLVHSEVDTHKFTLATLTRCRIRRAYSSLNRLSGLIDVCENDASDSMRDLLQEESNQFYYLIPNKDASKRSPSREQIAGLFQMLNDLMGLATSYSLLGMDAHSCLNPVDQLYARLDTKLTILDSNKEEYSRIMDFVRFNQRLTHPGRLVVTSIIAIEKPGEENQFDSYGEAARQNRQILWHHVPRTGLVAVLSQGIKLPSPEAPPTRGLFGRGIYFTDILSRIDQQFDTIDSKQRTVFLLCEVILGNMQECLHATTSTLPANFQSRKGLGLITPDVCLHHTDTNGAIYPIGDPKQSTIANGSFEFNEFAVYAASQVKQKYLVCVDFVC